MQGWIKLYRQLMDKAIWKCSTLEQKVILITLLMMANHDSNEWEWQGEKFACRPGQFITSLQSIADNAGKGITIQNIRTALKKFEKYEFLTNQSTKTGRLITIVNWSLYQAKQKETNKEYNKELTNDQQTDNKDLTSNKNDNNDKNEKEDIVILSDDENKFITILTEIENYPLDRKKDLEMYHSLSERYPELDLLEAIEDFRQYKMDKPLQNKSNPRAQINTSFKRYVEWGKCLKRNIPVPYEEENPFLNRSGRIQEDQRVGVPPSESVLGEREEPWM